MTTDTIPANARTAPDDRVRHADIASIVFDMDDWLGRTQRIMEGALFSLNALQEKNFKDMKEKEIVRLLDAVSSIVEVAIDHHSTVYEQWRTLFRLTREDKADA